MATKTPDEVKQAAAAAAEPEYSKQQLLTSHRNHKAQPLENKPGIAKGSSSYGQGCLRPTHFNLADRSHCLQIES